MKKRAKYVLPLFLLMLSAAVNDARSVVITATGSWSETVDSLDLQAGAGSELVGSYESSSNQASLDITAASSWQVDIKRVDGTWHDNLNLYAKRTSDGTGDGNVSGGAFYLIVTDTDQSFFSGSADRAGMEIQLKIDGVSTQVPPAAYNTTVYYTVVDTI